MASGKILHQFGKHTIRSHGSSANRGGQKEARLSAHRGHSLPGKGSVILVAMLHGQAPAVALVMVPALSGERVRHSAAAKPHRAAFAQGSLPKSNIAVCRRQ